MIDHPKEDALQLARKAFSRRGWHDVYELLEPLAASHELGAIDLEMFADAAWWIGKFERSIEAREETYALYMGAGNSRSAARVALNLQNDYGHRLASAISAGWMARAERLLEDDHECAEYALFLRAHTNMALGHGHADRAYDGAKEMLAIAERLANRDLQALAVHEQGRALVQMGQVAEGMKLLDEAAVAAVSGELGPIATAVIYCNVIGVCRSLADYRQAGDWTEAATRWCERQAIHGFPGICRVYRAEIMRLRGDWAAAEAEARQARDELQGWALDVVGAAFNEIGEIRLRMGDLESAEQAFRQAHEAGLDPQPGIAMWRVAQGNVKGAAASIRRSLEEKRDRLDRARLLPAGAEIFIEAGDLDTARTYAAELEETATAFDTAALHAAAASTRGAVSLAEGECRKALKSLREACGLWNEVDAPYEVARTRGTLAKAYRADGDEASAKLELEAALAVFERLGAAPDALRVRAMLNDEQGQTVATSRQSKTFMFTDVCASTSLVEAIGDQAWEDVLRWHDKTLRSLFAEHGGQEIKQLGEGFFVAFDTPGQAIACAVAIQRRLAEHRRTAGFSPQVRVGLHESQAIRRGNDYAGKGVHVAARVGALAGAGEILCSQDTLRAAEGAPVPVSGRQEVTLKGLAQPIELAAIDWR